MNWVGEKSFDWLHWPPVTIVLIDRGRTSRGFRSSADCELENVCFQTKENWRCVSLMKRESSRLPLTEGGEKTLPTLGRNESQLRKSFGAGENLKGPLKPVGNAFTCVKYGE